jgi:endonuclease/exonuclease/phosphatase family metal-dependent hydrolase
MPIEIHKDYYVGSSQNIPAFEDKVPYTTNRAVLTIKVEYDNRLYCIATTHFTWTEGGQVTDLQRKDFDNMKNILDQANEFVLMGDFNTPRGRDLYSELSRVYKDNIPLEIITTLDPTLHKVPSLEYVVDGIFSTKNYHVSNVSVVGGISDHKALIAQVLKSGTE